MASDIQNQPHASIPRKVRGLVFKITSFPSAIQIASIEKINDNENKNSK